MTFEELQRKLQLAIDRAVFVVGQQAISDMLPFVPIASGELRKSFKIEKGSRPGEIEIQFGKGLPYAEIQHEEELNHLGDRGNYQSLGSIQSTYSKNYRKAIDEKKLKSSQAKWLDAVLRDDANLNKLQNLFVRVVRQSL